MSITSFKVKESSTPVAAPQGLHPTALAQIITSGAADISTVPNGNGLIISIMGSVITTTHSGAKTGNLPPSAPKAAEITTDAPANIFVEPGQDGSVVVSVEPTATGGGPNIRYTKVTINGSGMLFQVADGYERIQEDIHKIQRDIRRINTEMARCCRQQHLPHSVKKAPKKGAEKKSVAKKSARKDQKKSGK